MDAVILFLREVRGGVALGLAASGIMHAMLVRVEEYGTQIAEQVEVSGPIAMVVTGLVIRNVTIHRLDRRETTPFKTFWRAVDEVLNAMLFVLIGLNLAVIPQLDPLLLLAAIIICLAARWLSVYVFC